MAVVNDRSSRLRRSMGRPMEAQHPSFSLCCMMLHCLGHDLKEICKQEKLVLCVAAYAGGQPQPLSMLKTLLL